MLLSSRRLSGVHDLQVLHRGVLLEAGVPDYRARERDERLSAVSAHTLPVPEILVQRGKDISRRGPCIYQKDLPGPQRKIWASVCGFRCRPLFRDGVAFGPCTLSLLVLRPSRKTGARF